MTLFTKCILSLKLPEDGVRISIMNRHTLEDGVTIDSRITPELYDQHLVVFAPPSLLLGDYYKRGLNFEDYSRRYLEYLRTMGVSEKVDLLALRATQIDITLLCIEETAEKCHRRLLAEECLKREPSLIVVHR